MSETRLGLVPARQRSTLAKLRRDRWVGAREGGPPGNTQDALARLGVAETRWVKKPYERQVCRLTELGETYVREHLTAPADEAFRLALEKIAADRVAAGTCRHCGGPVPCWSPYGDVEVGVSHRSREKS